MLLWGHPLMKLFVLIVSPSVSFLFEITINPLAVASFDLGLMILATIIATTKFLIREDFSLIILSKPNFLIVSKIAIT
ncbi:hypothetical protein NIES3804_17810 [Microcystis aeruginosa NIES-3804]|uniref:Uncharacterized protein n=1 Tax=Microcystis aeruginosa NIES-3804 TaxID=2517783 RepID=A0A6H9GII3_MICAE|nr:hypothetical protein NIES3804_17810 [Microcystis aeruginosa NIES-3804]